MLVFLLFQYKQNNEAIDELEEDEEESSNFSDIDDMSFGDEKSPEEELALFLSQWKNELYGNLSTDLSSNKQGNIEPNSVPCKEEQVNIKLI